MVCCPTLIQSSVIRPGNPIFDTLSNIFKGWNFLLRSLSYKANNKTFDSNASIIKIAKPKLENFFFKGLESLSQTLIFKSPYLCNSMS